MQPSPENDGLTRRDFIRTAAIGAAGVAFGVNAFSRDATAVPPSKWKTGATVVDVRSPRWRADAKVDAAFVRKMVDYGVCRLTGKNALADAWRTIVEPTDVVGVKFNAEPGDYTGANAALVGAIAAGLVASGVKTGNIIVVEADSAGWKNAIAPNLEHRDRVEFAPAKWTRLTPFITDQVDCLINVPNLMDHRWGGIAGCLLGIALSPSIISNPDLYTGGDCVAAAVGINKLEIIRTKRRLHIVNGLVGIFDGGPVTNDPKKQWAHNGLLFATDPVACDRVHLDILQDERTRRELPDLFDRACTPIHIEKATRARLGVGNLNTINWIKNK